MRARIRLFGLIDQNASESWLDTCGWLISFQHQTVVDLDLATGPSRRVNQLKPAPGMR
jgi:hypothetical protein